MQEVLGRPLTRREGPGEVYILRLGNGPSQKVGYTTRDPEKRLEEWQRQCPGKDYKALKSLPCKFVKRTGKCCFGVGFVVSDILQNVSHTRCCEWRICRGRSRVAGIVSIFFDDFYMLMPRQAGENIRRSFTSGDSTNRRRPLCVWWRFRGSWWRLILGRGFRVSVSGVVSPASKSCMLIYLG